MYSDASDASHNATLPISSGTGEGGQSMPPTAEESEQDYPLNKKADSKANTESWG
ncbi:hypothetical protein [Muriicola sp.]|uniref:hypothetical protein n=1 Tax=Muriicola sp. TaxID=2020856 RepID=UPI003C794E20